MLDLSETGDRDAVERPSLHYSSAAGGQGNKDGTSTEYLLATGLENPSFKKVSIDGTNIERGQVTRTETSYDVLGVVVWKKRHRSSETGWISCGIANTQTRPVTASEQFVSW